MEENQDFDRELSANSFPLENAGLQTYQMADDADYLIEHRNVLDSFTSIDACRQKIEEYENALQQRDQVIKQLELKLQECAHERDLFEEEANKKCVEFSKEVESLQLKLKESINLLQNKSGVNLKEHMELKNKLILLQEDRSVEKEQLESLERELKAKSEALTDRDQKYKLLVRVHKDLKEKQLLEIKEREDTLKEEHKEQLEGLLTQHISNIESKDQCISTLEEQLKNYQEEVSCIKKELNESKKTNLTLAEKCQKDKFHAESQIQDMIREMRHLKDENEKMSSEKETILLESEKRIESLRNEMSEKHNNELESLKEDHKSQVVSIYDQIKLLEEAQQVDQAKMVEDIAKFVEETNKCKNELEEEKFKNENLTKELEEAKLLILELESKDSLRQREITVNSEQCQQNQKLMEEMKAQQNCLENKIEDLKTEILMLNKNEKSKEIELRDLKKQFEDEKAAKNEINLRIQELSVKNESLLTELKIIKDELEAALSSKNLLENKIIDLNKETEEKEIKLFDLESKCKDLELNFEKSCEGKIISENKIFDLEKELKIAKEENSIKSKQIYECENQLKSIEIDCNKFKSEVSTLEEELQRSEHERVILSNKLSQLKKERESETCYLEGKVASLLKEIGSLKLSLNDMEKYKNQCHIVNERIVSLTSKVLAERDSYSSDVEVMRDLSFDSDAEDPFSVLEAEVSLISEKLLETESITSEFHSILKQKDFYKTQLDELNAKLKNNNSDQSLGKLPLQKEAKEKCDDVACQTNIPTREQGFQTSGSDNSELLTTKTIEEDYMVEEILVVPKSISLKGSVSLRNLNEIAITTTETCDLPAEYEKLKAKFHESQFLIKSLENENSHLKRALQFKKSAVSSDESHNSVSKNRKALTVLDTKDTGEDKVQNLSVNKDEASVESVIKEHNAVNVNSTEAISTSVLESKLLIQVQLNESLREELKVKVQSGSHLDEDWKHYLNKSLNLYVENRHPYFRRKDELISSILNGWQEALHDEEPNIEERKSETNDKNTILEEILLEMKKLVDEQRSFQKILKDIENNIISHLDNSILHCTQEANRDNALEFMLGDMSSGNLRGTPGNISTAVDVSEDDLLREFDEVSSSIVNGAQEEKVKLHENQRIMLKVLEDNQRKISVICRNHLEKLKDTSALEDVENVTKKISDEIDSSLREESSLVGSVYEDLLKQYSHEQSMHSQSNALTLNELKLRISSLLQHSKYQTSVGNMDLWKRLLSTLSQVTLNLLHYYSISQRFANNEPDQSSFIPDIHLPIGGGCGPQGFHYLEDSEEESSLKITDCEGRSIPDEGGISTLDTTGASEGMLDDVERNEQVKEILTSSYPNLSKTLKGNYDQVSLETLEKEVQELIISLQASTGMLRIFMLSKADKDSYVSSTKTITAESGIQVNISETSTRNPSITTETQFSMNENDNPHKEEGRNSLAEGLSIISVSDSTILRPHINDFKEEIEELKIKLDDERKLKDELQKQLHQSHGLYAGLQDEKKSILSELKKKDETITHLTMELKDAKKLLQNAEEKLENESSKELKVKQGEKNVKDKVKAVLAAKDKQSLDQGELMQRVRDLEVILEETVTERDKSVDALNLKVSDLTQQLEVADRQLRSSRQFLEEQATERDLELDDLVKANEKLRNQIKEKDMLVNQYSGLQREVQMLEKELREKYSSVEEERAKYEEKRNEHVAALEKIKDLREVVQSLECQLAVKCTDLECLQSQYQGICQDLKEAKKCSAQLQSELDAVSQSNLTAAIVTKNADETKYHHFEDRGAELRGRILLERQVSLSEELENLREGEEEKSQQECDFDARDRDKSYQNTIHEYAMIDSLIERLEKSTLGLETLQFTLVSGSAISDEELSVREQMEISGNLKSEKSRSLSPGSLEAKLEEKLVAFERAAESAAKYAKDLEMRLSNLKNDYDEAVNEREELHQRLSTLSDIKSDLQKALEESKTLEQDFKRNVTSLKEELIQSKEKERSLSARLKELEESFSSKSKEFERTLSSETKRMEKEHKNLETEKNEMQQLVKEFSEEKEMLRRQNSEQLIKISGLEARLEDFKRADSPYEFELKSKILFLQEELERCRAELTSKFREVEDLRYSVKELQDKLVLREEELERLNQPQEPVSIPQTTVDQRRHQLQALEGEIEKQRLMNKNLTHKLEGCIQPSNSDQAASNALLESILDEKNSQIKELNLQKKEIIECTQQVLAAVEAGKPINEVTKFLRNYLSHKSRRPSEINESENEEIQRRAPFQSPDDVAYDVSYLNETKIGTGSKSGSSSLNSAQSDSSQHKLEENSKLSLCAPLGDPRANRKTILAKQKKLEDDFAAAQEMLESKEEEIQTLTEEMEDSLPTPLRTDVHIYEERVRELMIENESLENRCKELESQVKAKSSSGEVEKMSEELDRLREDCDSNSSKYNQLQKEKDEVSLVAKNLEMKLREEMDKYQSLRSHLEALSVENGELSSQIELIRTQFKDSNMRHEKRIKTLEREHFEELQDMKDKNIEREKQLCNEYEERMSAQVSDLSVKLVREKEAALKSVREYYQELLSKANDHDLREKEKEIEGISTSQDSEDLQRSLQKELKISASLDHSILHLMEGGSGGSRESSVISEEGAPQEGNLSNIKIQNLMRKVHKDGIQVLTLAEFLFLQNNRDTLEEKVFAGLIPENIPDSHENESAPDRNSVKLKKKIELLEFALSQEKSLNKKLEEVLSRRKEEIDDLREDVLTERSKWYSNKSSEVSYSKGSIQLLEKELLFAQQEIKELRGNLEASEKQVKDLEEALCAERKNFNNVSTTLNHQRKLAASTNDHQNQVIKDLRNCLEKERSRVLALMNELHDVNASRSSHYGLEDALNNSYGAHSSLLIDKEMRIREAFDKERELQREVRDLQISLETLTDKRAYERDQYMKDLQEEHRQVEQLQTALALAEGKVNKFISEIKGKDAIIRDFEMKLKAYQKEIASLKESIFSEKKRSPRNDPANPQTQNQGEHKPVVQKENRGIAHEIPMKEDVYFSSLNKLSQKDLEIETLQQKLSQLETELKRSKERERTFITETQKNAELSNAPRIKNLSEFLEFQQRENIELCKSLARLTDDRRLFRQRILMLEGVVDELNMQLANQEKYLIRENLNEKNFHSAERAALAAEAAALKLALRQAETRNEDLTREIESLKSASSGQNELACKREEFTTKYLYWKYNRSESYRKALIWQKEYLIHLLRGHQHSKERAIGRLTTLAQNVFEEGAENQKSVEKVSPKSRFRSAALVIVALQRMKILKKRWLMSRKLKTVNRNTVQHSESPSPSSSPSLFIQHLPTTPVESSKSPAYNLERGASILPKTNFCQDGYPITGLTPPTKDVSDSKKGSQRPNQSRNLFGKRNEDESDLNDCIERLDYIHSQLGLPKASS